MSLAKRTCAEFIGTFWLVFGGCGSAVLARAIVAGGWALQQLWLIWVAPIIGAALAGLAFKAVSKEQAQEAAAVKARASGLLPFVGRR
jgi:glycerol uptake facilitator-like aquaporin